MSGHRSAESLCPGCKGIASVRVLNYGWLFRCDACAWEYGHPQFTSRTEALDDLARARGLT